jgi:hypothetical protein
VKLNVHVAKKVSSRESLSTARDLPERQALHRNRKSAAYTAFLAPESGSGMLLVAAFEAWERKFAEFEW